MEIMINALHQRCGGESHRRDWRHKSDYEVLHLRGIRCPVRLSASPRFS